MGSTHYSVPDSTPQCQSLRCFLIPSLFLAYPRSLSSPRGRSAIQPGCEESRYMCEAPVQTLSAKVQDPCKRCNLHRMAGAHSKPTCSLSKLSHLTNILHCIITHCYQTLLTGTSLMNVSCTGHSQDCVLAVGFLGRPTCRGSWVSPGFVVNQAIVPEPVFVNEGLCRKWLWPLCTACAYNN